MTALFNIAPTDLRDYAKSQGWTMIQEATKDRLYVLTNGQFPRRQLAFPMDTTAPDYGEAVSLVVEKLSELEGGSVQHILGRLQSMREDTLSFRLTSEREIGKSIPLPFANSVIWGVQNLLLSAASTVLRPRRHHPRLSFSEAQQFIDSARFRHTESGSFVVKVSCPLNALDGQSASALDNPEVSFVRQSTITLQKALRQLVSAIEQDSVDDFVRTTYDEQAPIVSSNLCDAISRCHDSRLENSLEVNFDWAIAAPRPKHEFNSKPIRIQSDYFQKIEEVREALRAEDREREDIFVGTVERLAGDMQFDGRRAGEVILSLLLPEGEMVKARTILNAQQYENAYEAHNTDRIYVRVFGRLHPGRQPRALTDITKFDLIPKD